MALAPDNGTGSSQDETPMQFGANLIVLVATGGQGTNADNSMQIRFVIV